jgi:heptosyltransferase-3
MKPVDVGTPARALVVSLRYLGDALLTTPLVRALKERWPDCAVDVLAFAGTEGAFEGNADVAQVIAVPETAGTRATLAQAGALTRRYDLAVIAQTGTRPFFFGLVAARRRIGLVSPDIGKSWWKRALLHGHAVFDPAGARVLENQRLAALLGSDAPPRVVPPTAHWSDDDVARARNGARGPFAVVHPSPRWRYKQWTADGWGALIARLEGHGLAVVITGSAAADERRYLDDVLAPVAARVLRVDGQLSFAQTADVLRRAQLYVGPDTATTHLAAACGTPTLALYGPTDPAIWGPWPARDGAPYAHVAASQQRGNVLLLQNPELACVPCQLEGCERHRASYALCLDRLPAERVIDASALLLRSRP